MEPEVREILQQFGLSPDLTVSPIGSGHIHWTYLVAAQTPYVLQRLNTSVFTQPEIIESNLQLAATHLREQHPEYRFVAPIPTLGGHGMAYDTSERPWRLLPWLANTLTIDEAETAAQAYNAAAEFGRLARNLEQVDVTRFRPSIPRFHDLPWRYEQFEQALAIASEQRKTASASQIRACQSYRHLVDRFDQLVHSQALRQRVFHNDTKINNVLFDQDRTTTVAAIDLDTLMPGYFIFDLGDLMRTVVSPVSEEESDLDRIEFRREFYDALVEGYLSEMREILTVQEREQIPFAGPMMTYIMALRFLADFLRGDTYYRIHYPDHNLVRARNQLRHLENLLRHVSE